MTDIVEKMQSQVGDDVQRVFDHEALFKGAIVEITTLRADLAKVRRDNVTEPAEPGAFVGDVFFGHPIKTTMGTHKWDGAAWVALPSETEALLELLAEARRRAETAEAALRSQRAEVLRVIPDRIEILRILRGASGCKRSDYASALDDYFSHIKAQLLTIALIDAPKEQG